jgi:hypothetical protein
MSAVRPALSNDHKVSILVICSRSDKALARRTSAFCRAAAYWGNSLSITEIFNACLPCCSTKLSSRLAVEGLPNRLQPCRFLFPSFLF